jgi:hypothetical protein
MHGRDILGQAGPAPKRNRKRLRWEIAMKTNSRAEAWDVFERITRYRAEHPDASWREVYANVPSHYGSHNIMGTMYRRLLGQDPDEFSRDGLFCDLCEECTTWGVVYRFRGRWLCKACLCPDDPPMDAVAWSEQMPQASSLAEVERLGERALNEDLYREVAVAYQRMLLRMGRRNPYAWVARRKKRHPQR